ncbi:MAG: alpha/beta fold hydrolase [Syntrophaceae bacterium]|nr:alpha/beta fold hydrolase [Syntrophaceae bacterium]
MPHIRVNDLNLYFEASGSGEPLVFLHGLGSSTRDWERQVAFFSSCFQVVTFDSRGHGRTDKPKGLYSIPQFAQDAAAFLKAVGAAPAHIVGLSMGGMTAFQLAVDEPELVKSLTVVNSGPALVLTSSRDRRAFFLRRLIVRFLGMRKMGTILADMLLPELHQKDLHDTMVARWADNDRRAYLASMKALTGWSVADRLGEIRCPVLIVTADQDYTPVSLKEAYARQIPGAELAVIRKSRHLTPIDQTEAFNEVLLGFLSSHAGVACIAGVRREHP